MTPIVASPTERPDAMLSHHSRRCSALTSTSGLRCCPATAVTANGSSAAQGKRGLWLHYARNGQIADSDEGTHWESAGLPNSGLLGLWETRNRALKPTPWPHKTLHRIGQHKKISLSIRSVVLDDLLRGDGSPFIIDPSIPAILRIRLVARLDLELDSHGITNAAAEPRIVITLGV
jgi:hypothetical protein